MKPMTTEEIDAIEMAARTGGECPSVDDFYRLLATARLSPQWRKGSEPPDAARDVVVWWNGLVTVAHYMNGVWYKSGSVLSMLPELWTELPTPPSEQEGGR